MEDMVIEAPATRRHWLLLCVALAATLLIAAL
jgi:hypothetical protein